MRSALKKTILPDIITDTALSAKQAGLRYVSDNEPGIYRKALRKEEHAVMELLQRQIETKKR
jgi:hypothetical protein